MPSAIKMKFKQGDIVRVERKVDRRTRDFQNKWTADMDAYIGQIFEVEKVGVYGVDFIENTYSFPPASLRLIKRDGKYYYMKGDIVEVPNDMTGHVPWVSSMSDMVGGIYKVEHIAPSGNVSLPHPEGIHFNFRPEWVRLVGHSSKYESAPKPTPPKPKPVEPLQEWEKF